MDGIKVFGSGIMTNYGKIILLRVLSLFVCLFVSFPPKIVFCVCVSLIFESKVICVYVSHIFICSYLYLCISCIFIHSYLSLCISVYLFTFICLCISYMFITVICVSVSLIFLFTVTVSVYPPYHYLHSSVSVYLLYLSKHANLLCVALPFPSPFHHAIIFLSPDKYPTLQIFFFTPWFRSGSQIPNTSSSARIFVQRSLHPLCRAR